jgi:hypothetical protein
MDTYAFITLCRDASRALGLEDVDRLASTGQVWIDDIEITLIFDEEHKDRLFCYVEVGSVESLDASSDCVRAYRDMLTLNLLRGSKTAGVIALDPVSNGLVLVSHLINPDSYDGTQLAALLRDHASDSTFAREVWAARVEAQVPQTPEREILNLA